jgi:hypothetical protein
VRVEAGVRDSAAKVSFAARKERLVCFEIQVLLGKAEIHQVDLVNVFWLTAHYEVRRLHISVDYACAVDVLNGDQHLQ